MVVPLIPSKTGWAQLKMWGHQKNFFSASRRNNYYRHCAPPLLKSFRRLWLCHCFKVMICMYVCYMLFNKYSILNIRQIAVMELEGVTVDSSIVVYRVGQKARPQTQYWWIFGKVATKNVLSRALSVSFSSSIGRAHKVHETTTFLLVTLPNLLFICHTYSPINFFHCNKPFLISLPTTPTTP